MQFGLVLAEAESVQMLSAARTLGIVVLVLIFTGIWWIKRQI